MRHLHIRHISFLNSHCMHLFCLCVLTIFMGYLTPAHADTADFSMPCHTIRTTADEVPAGYGSPLSFFSTYPTALMRVFCGIEGGARITVGDGADKTYIYKYGYHKTDGKRERITFSGAHEVGGVWLKGSAEAIVNGSTKKKGTVYAYICQLVDGMWKCGCKDAVCAVPYWQIQTYTPVSASQTALTLSMDAYLEMAVPGLQEFLKKSNTTLEKLEAEAYKNSANVLTDTFDAYVVNPLVVSSGSTTKLTVQNAPNVSNGMAVTWISVDTNKEVYTQKGLPSTDGHTLTLNVPVSAPGKYTLKVHAEGKIAQGNPIVWITDPERLKPTIDRITPELGPQGGTFTVYGTNFSRVRNDISTLFGMLENVASPDGKMLTFTYTPFGEAVRFRGLDGSFTTVMQKIFLSVINEGGESVQDSPKYFTLTM